MQQIISSPTSRNGVGLGPAHAQTDEMADFANPQPELDRRISRLQQHKQTWAELPVLHKIYYLEQILQNTAQVAEKWVAAACQAKQIPAGSPLVGEEWLAGPWAVIWAAQHYRMTLQALQDGKNPLELVGKVRTGINGQVIAQVFPLDLFDRLLVSGVRAEVWMEPDVTMDSLAATVARFFRNPDPVGQVALVLGAGNIASIAPNDVLYKLIAEGAVCLLKLNPVNEYLGPILEEVFADLHRAGFIEFAYGGVQVGQYLVDHPGIDTIHITGSARTHDASVFGSGEEGQARKRANRPRLDKHITSELGNVTPTIVVPGPWTEADLRFQAEHIATQKLNNASFNCVAAQILVTQAHWPQREQLLYHLRATLRQAPARYPYYPGAADRQRKIQQRYSQAEQIGPEEAPIILVPDLTPETAGDDLLQEEAFAAALAEVKLWGDDPVTFMREAVIFCNERLWGTLGANIIVHPRTMRKHHHGFEQMLSDLAYGSIGVNIWSAAGFMLSQTSWGAYPGHTLDNIGSGLGHVHNTFLFDRPQKSVIYGNFTPFPQNLSGRNLSGSHLLGRELHILPKPPWFVTNQQAAFISRAMTELAVKKSWRRLPGLFLRALRG